MRFTDPDGMKPFDWVMGADRNPYWDKNVTSENDKDLKQGDTYIGKSAYYTSTDGYTVHLKNKDLLPAGEKSWEYYVPNTFKSEEQVSDDVAASSSELLPTLNKDAKGILTGASIGNDLNQGTLQLLSLDKSLVKDIAGASKLLEGVGTTLGVVSFANDGATIINKGISNATAADWIKLGISGGQLLLKTNPWTIGFGLLYGIADATGNNPVDYILKK
jgi:hypothetical protein